MLRVLVTFMLLANCCEAEGTEAATHNASQVETYASRVERCRQNTADIFFIVDESGSVGEENFNKTLEFIKTVVTGLEIGPNDVQIGMLTYSRDVRAQFHFNTFSTKQDVLNRVASISYYGGGTRTHTALEYARENCFSSVHGIRSNAAQIAIVITDGKSNDKSKTVLEAERFNKDITVFAIGVGDGPDLDELSTIASDPDESHVFSVDDFDSLNVILTSLQYVACEARPVYLCGGQADIVFLLDMSQIFGEENLQRLLQFVLGVTDKFLIGLQDVQVGVDSFSAMFKHEFYLRQMRDKVSLGSAIYSISYSGGRMDTSSALKRMREQSFTASAGHRENVPKIAIVLTNGFSDNKEMTSSEARRARDDGITILVLGIGPEVDFAELQDIATDPDSQSVFEAAAFEALSSLEAQVAAVACGAVKQRPLGSSSSEKGCGPKADIVFAIDSSGSVGSHNFQLALNFINDVVEDLDIGQDAIRLGIETFNSRPDSSINLNSFSNKESLMDAVTNIEYRDGGSNVAAAINHMDHVMFTPGNGDRPGVPNIGVIMADGISSNGDDTTIAAQTAKDNDVIISTIGIGETISRSDLDEIASDPDSAHVLTVTGFDKLAAIRSAFLIQTCQHIPAVLPPYVPPIASPPSHGPDPCQDRVPNCADYDTSVCTNHELWANTNCARTCNICAPGTSTVETPCVDKELDCAYYSVTMCDTYRPWAMKNCRESCGYCGPGRQTSGFFGTCFYKGARYRQGDKWDDGCAYECECTDGNTGRYVCYNKCPSYYNFPDECKLVQKRNKCCLEPVCNFEVQYTTKNVSEWCVFNSRNYMQGEIWSVGCEFDCICVDPARQFYTCQSKCAQYGLLPSICKMVTPPGECCEKPLCEFQTQVGKFTGSGGPSGPGVSLMSKTREACTDKIPDCQTRSSDICTSQSQRSFALDNCRKSCHLCGQGLETTSSRSDVCLYKGQKYKQGETWYDGCDLACVCDNAEFGYVRCEARCPDYLNIPVGCSMVTVPGQCCGSLFCATPVTIIDSQTLPDTIGAMPEPYQVPKSGVYPTLPPGHVYAPGQDPDPTHLHLPRLDPNKVNDPEQNSSAVQVQDQVLRFSRGCYPAEEGHATTITCDLDTTNCSNLFVVKWGTDRRDIASCTTTMCGSFINSNEISITATSNNSTLTVRNVSRTSPVYNSEIRWTCSPCGEVEVTACDRLEVYARPQSPTCIVSEDIVSGDINSLTVSCSTKKIYPKAKCSFERILSDNESVLIDTYPTYIHTPTEERPVFYRAQCSVAVPIADLGEGTHSFVGYIYPDVTDGKSLVDAIISNTTVTFKKPVKNVATGARSDHLDAMLVGATTLVVFILTGSTDFAAATGL